jgi:hypothetical protein
MVSDSSESLNRLPPPISIAGSGDIDEHEFDEFEWDEESAQVTSISSTLLRNVNENGRSVSTPSEKGSLFRSLI